MSCFFNIVTVFANNMVTSWICEQGTILWQYLW